MSAKQSYQTQKWNAERIRGIQFLLTFEEWYNWWLQQGVDKNQPQPKKGPNTLCMCRFGDTGPYSLTNIYCDTVSGNVTFARQNKKYLAGPKGKKIMTPAGQFNSRKDAAIFYKITAASLYQRMKRYPTKYYYL